VAERVEAIRAADGGAQVPVDAVTASASGLDPHIGPAYARLQAPRVAEARGLELETVMALIEEHMSGRTFGFLGEPRVNVLELNIALDELAPLTTVGPP
jgi:K+-transporting ATPase ATPase C chain